MAHPLTVAAQGTGTTRYNMTRVVFRHLHNGVVLETDLITAKINEWAQSPESTDPTWSVVLSGRSVRALRLPPLGSENDTARALGASASFRSDGA